MALERDRTHSMSYESTSFRTKEGTYRKNSFRYCRETKKAHSGKELSSVAVSFVSCKDKDGSNDWITFNSAREYYFYPFHGVRKVGYRMKCKEWWPIPNNTHHIKFLNGRISRTIWHI